MLGQAEETQLAPVPQRSARWGQYLEGLSAAYPRSRQGRLNTTDVLLNMADTTDYDGIANFWDAYDQYRQDHPEYTYTLSPVDVIKRLNRRAPNSLYIMLPDDWDAYRDFKAANADFSYSH